MTMAYVVVGLGTVISAVLMRRSPETGLAAPIAAVAKLLVWPVVIIVLSTEISFLQNVVGATSLTGAEWLMCLGLLVLVTGFVEGHKWTLRRISQNRSARAASPSEPAR